MNWVNDLLDGALWEHLCEDVIAEDGVTWVRSERGKRRDSVGSRCEEQQGGQRGWDR